MSSEYITDMKNAILNYKNKKNQTEQRLIDIKNLYGEEAAEKEAERLNKQLQNARLAAETTINTAHGYGRTQAESWARPDGSKLTDDMKLFDAGLVTPEVFEELKGRYRNNSTMLSALKAQGEKLNAAAAKAENEKGGFSLSEPYNVRDIQTGADKIKAWDNMQKKALDALDMIDGTGRYHDPWDKALGAAMGDQVIEHFGEGSGL